MDKVQTLKGFRDFLPGKARKRQYAIDAMKKVFESYGFEPLETPALEYEEILMGKYGDEGDKLMYRFQDNGGRNVAMRYDQTVPLARVVAQYGSANSPQGQNGIVFPFKRYQIQPVWRAENTQKGRFREFLQSDIDTVGAGSPLSDAELLTVVSEVFKKLGFKDMRILLNDRALFRGIETQAIIIIDKLKKIGAEGVAKELKEKGFDPGLIDEMQNKKPTDNLDNIISAAQKMGVPDDLLVFEPTLARGLEYYTGIIIEVEIPSYDIGSVGGGGRYDNLIGMFAGRQVPAVGFAFGFDRILEAMEEQNLFPKNLSGQSRVLVTVFSPDLTGQSLALYAALKQNGVASELYLDDSAKMDRQLKYADAKKIPYVIIAGPDETSRSVVTLRDMVSREQKEMNIDSVLAVLQADKKE